MGAEGPTLSLDIQLLLRTKIQLRYSNSRPLPKFFSSSSGGIITISSKAHISLAAAAVAESSLRLKFGNILKETQIAKFVDIWQQHGLQRPLIGANLRYHYSTAFCTNQTALHRQ